MRTNSSFVLRNIYDRNILMPIKTNGASNDPILINEVAVSIWKLAENDSKRADILNEISRIYGLDIDSAELMAVDKFISQMEKMGLLIS